MTRGAGAYNRRIACDEPVITTAGNGEQLVSYVQTFEAWANVQPLRGRENLKSGETTTEMDTRITLRWSERNSAITPRWRFRYGSTFYHIAAPPMDIDLGHREIEFLCKSGMNQG